MKGFEVIYGLLKDLKCDFIIIKLWNVIFCFVYKIFYWGVDGWGIEDLSYFFEEKSLV